MLDQAAAVGTARPVEWRQADAMHQPFDDGAFDAVVCQFGVMFFPDKVAAFAEARRVLRPGGVFVFNVWDRIAENEFTDVVTTALESVFPADPPALHGPHPARLPRSARHRTRPRLGWIHGGAHDHHGQRAQPGGIAPYPRDRDLSGIAAAKRDRSPRPGAARRRPPTSPRRRSPGASATARSTARSRRTSSSSTADGGRSRRRGPPRKSVRPANRFACDRTYTSHHD